MHDNILSILNYLWARLIWSTIWILGFVEQVFSSLPFLILNFSLILQSHIRYLQILISPSSFWATTYSVFHLLVLQPYFRSFICFHFVTTPFFKHFDYSNSMFVLMFFLIIYLPVRHNFVMNCLIYKPNQPSILTKHLLINLSLTISSPRHVVFPNFSLQV